jgi:hypothetical protein
MFTEFTEFTEFMFVVSRIEVVQPVIDTSRIRKAA